MIPHATALVVRILFIFYIMPEKTYKRIKNVKSQTIFLVRHKKEGSITK